MAITSAMVLFAVSWFMTFLVVLPLRMVTQGEAGDVVAGTHSSAPANLNLRRKVIVTTIAATLVWGVICTIILSGWLTIENLSWFAYPGEPAV